MVLVELWGILSGKTDHIKNKNQQSNLPSGPPNGLKLHETKEKHAVYSGVPVTNEWKRKKKGICEAKWLFTQIVG